MPVADRKHSPPLSGPVASASASASSPAPDPPPPKRLKLDGDQGIDSPGSDSSSDAFSALTIEEAANGHSPAQDVVKGNGQHRWSEEAWNQRKVELAKLRKEKKLERIAATYPAEFHYDTRGFKNRTISLSDVRNLVLHLYADEKPQPWMVLKNKRTIKQTIVLMIPGITRGALGVSPVNITSLPFPIYSKAAMLPVMQTLFSHAMPTRAAGDRFKMHSCMQTFMTSPLSQSAKNKRDDDRRRSLVSHSPEARDPTTYLVPAEVMMDQGYPATTYQFPATAAVRQLARKSRSMAQVSPPPLPPRPLSDWQRPDGWIQTPAPPGGVSGNDLKILGIDCEMCLADSGSVLARISVVNIAGETVYDALVQPAEPIVDYVTRYSGITPERLAGVTTTLVDVQRRLAELLDFDTALVGHSLECDLRVLKLAHPWVIDTSVIYHHPKGAPYKPSLKWLAEKWLDKQIQVHRPVVDAQGGDIVMGHDSEEDARAAVELLLKKLEKGPGYGEFANDTEAIFDRMLRGPHPKTAAVIDHGHAGQWMAPRARTSLGFKSDAEVIDGIIATLPDHDLVVGRLLDLSRSLGWITPPRPNRDGPSDPEPESEPEDLADAYNRLNANILRLHTALSPGTALIIFTGHGDPREMGRLSQKKARFDRLYKTQAQSTIDARDRWMAEDERALADAVAQCKMGLSFFRVR